MADIEIRLTKWQNSEAKLSREKLVSKLLAKRYDEFGKPTIANSQRPK